MDFEKFRVEKLKNRDKDMNEQHKDMYFQSGKTGKSYLTIEWYNQHGCGFKDSEETNGIDCHTGKSTILELKSFDIDDFI